jgi:hypothetical protein
VKEYLITSGFLDRQRKLILTSDFVEWESGDLKGREFSRLNKSDIVDFKHGMDWIVWYKFTVGRQFSITFKDQRNTELKILFRSLFGLHKENSQKYSNIVDDIWRLYHSNIVDNFLDTFYDHGETEIQGIKLKNEGIELREQKEMIPWDKVATKDYYKFFSIYHQDNPAVYSTVGYNEYGTQTLWSAIRTILKERQTHSSE